jgi:hypothetical protein
MTPNDQRRPAPDQHDSDGAIQGHFPHEGPETDRRTGGYDRFNPPEEWPGPGVVARPVTEKVNLTLDLQDDSSSVVTWENCAPLTLHLSTGGTDLTLILGSNALRQLRQCLSWAAGQPAELPRPVPNGPSVLSPEPYLGGRREAVNPVARRGQARRLIGLTMDGELGLRSSDSLGAITSSPVRISHPEERTMHDPTPPPEADRPCPDPPDERFEDRQALDTWLGEGGALGPDD